ncbi:MAG: PAS domain-containing protein, partial [Planctomycetes bacterium]|nr:PAS domain-containing protein [Planctomycetota bacterium]
VRDLSEAQRIALEALGRQVVCHLEARLQFCQREALVQDLLESRERHELVVRCSRDGIWDVDRARNTAFCSARAREVLDVDPADVRAPLFDWIERVHVDDAADVADTIAAALRAREPYDVEFRWRLRDGGYRWIQVRAAAIQLADGRVTRIAGSVADVSGRRRADESLRRMSQLLQTAQEMAMVGGFEIDLRTQQLSWSDEVYRIHETTPEEYTPTVESAIAFYSPESLRVVQAAVDEAMATGRPYAFELELITAKGRKIWVASNGAAVFEEGAPVRIVGAFQDITERRRVADELRAAKEAAEAASRAKSAFLATMSHEIRTPMNGVLGYASLLQETPLQEQQREYLAVIERSGQSLLRIIDDILDYAKIEAGHLQLERIELDPRQLVAEAVQLLEPRAAEKGLRLSVHSEEGVPELLIGDPWRLQQILVNLLGNAVKFTAEGGVEVGVRWGAGQLRVAVRDSGIGISAEQQALLFQEFSQADSSTRRRFGGTGLGLAISLRLVQSMGGTIGVDSEPGRGATFWFEVPLQVASAASEHPTTGVPPVAPSDAPAATTARARVLLVEDNDVNRHLATKFLASLACEVEVAENGVEAVEKARSGDFELILMDCLMPEMDGYEATRVIRQQEAAGRRRVPIVALTANALTSDRQDCFAAGMDDYLAKPFRKADLERVVQRWARRRT